MSLAKQVKELRQITGAGILDAKNVLEETNGNIEEAVKLLREKGMSKAAKKGDRITAEGLVKAATDGKKAVIVEVNSETDFVAKNTEFQSLVDKIAQAALANDINTVEELENVKVDGEVLKDLIVSKIATIGEKLTLRRVGRIDAGKGSLGVYNHFNGQEASIVELHENDVDLANNIALHIVASKPEYAQVSEVPADIIKTEEDIVKARELEAGKPEKIITERILPGVAKKYYGENVLVEQAYFHDSSRKVGELSNVESFMRFKVGEGIEKVESNFAEEVMAQVGQNK
jgi:elongation factor Ts